MRIRKGVLVIILRWSDIFESSQKLKILVVYSDIGYLSWANNNIVMLQTFIIFGMRTTYFQLKGINDCSASSNGRLSPICPE